MAITYHAGRRIQGISTGYSTVSYEEDFTSTPAGWVTADSTQITVTDGVLRTTPNESSAQQIVATIDLSNASNLGSNLSNTIWTVDFTFDIKVRTSSQSSELLNLFVSLGDDTNIYSTQNDAIRAKVNQVRNDSSDGNMQIGEYNNGTLGNYNSTNGSLTSTGLKYARIVRISSTQAKFIVSANSDWSSPVYDQTITISSGIIDLKYFKVQVEVSGSQSNRLDVDIDKLRVYNGVNRGTTEYEITTTSSDKTLLTNVQVGSRFEETDTRKMYYRFDATAYVSADWYEFGTVPYAGGRGVFGGGNAPNDTMDYITIATLGNATDFGDLSYGRGISANNPSNGTRGVYGGSNSSTSLDYITISTLGNSTTFGNNTQARNWNCGLDDQTTRGVYGGGDLGATVSNVMDYITIATTGNATDFGDLSASRSASGCVSTTTRGVFTGGTTASANTNIIDYITISTTGNATDFGDCTTANAGGGGADNNTRGVFWLGYDGSAPYEIINYITIATTGNATDFGDLITAGYGSGAVDNKTRGVKASGSGAGDAMEYFTIATTGNAIDFGDLTTSRFMTGGVD